MEITISLLIILITSNVLWFWRKAKADLAKSIWEERAGNLALQLEELNEKLSQTQDENKDLSNFRGRFDQAQILIDDLKLQNQNQQKNIELLNHKIAEIDKRSEILRQNSENLQKEKQEWSKDKEVILYKLFEDLTKKSGEINSDLFKRFENVLNKVSSLEDDVKKSTNDINLTKNALLNPGGAGKTSEITLENILKASGLKERISVNDAGDFILQSHFFGSDNSAKRPDAIVFLPGNHLLIIDSKSSSHFLDLQQAIDSGDAILEKEFLNKVKESMRRHLEDLKKRDYAKAKLEEIGLKNLFDDKEPPIVSTIMFLQTEKMLEIVRMSDHDLENKALQSGIPILSPIGLIHMLSQSKILIDRSKQEENITQLRAEITKLINGIAGVFAKSEAIGKSISKSLKSYNEFTGTFNRTFLPRIKNMGKLGVEIESQDSLKKLNKLESDGNFAEGEIMELED